MSEETPVPSPTDEEREVLRREAGQNVPLAHQALSGDASALAKWRSQREKEKS